MYATAPQCVYSECTHNVSDHCSLNVSMLILGLPNNSLLRMIPMLPIQMRPLCSQCACWTCGHLSHICVTTAELCSQTHLH